MQRLRTELRDMLELVLLPGLAAILPWRWCFAVFKRLARLQWLYREPCEAALQQARSRGWAGVDEAHWLWVRRLVTLVDHADHYLGLWRSDAWMQKHLQVTGQWPAPDQAVLLASFHWGAGYWGLRHAAAHGLHPHALVASLGTQVYQGRTVLSWYASARNANVAATLGAATIDIAKHLKQVIRALRNQHPLLGVLDVPRGLLRLAVDQKVPVVLYITGLDTSTGGRFLRIKPLGVSSTVDDLASQVFGELEQLIAQDAPAWHFWGIADRFFERP